MGERRFNEVDERSSGPFEPRTGGAPGKRTHRRAAATERPVDGPVCERAEPRRDIVGRDVSRRAGMAEQVPPYANREVGSK
jgi:hypothetical protein